MKSWIFSMVCVAAAVAPVSAQFEPEVPLQRPDEEAVTSRQTEELYDVLGPVTRDVSPSTVWVWSGKRLLSMGTVVGDGRRVLAKWSQLAFARGALQVVGGRHEEATAQVVGVYEDDDLAVLELVDESVSFPPVQWSSDPSPSLGRFLVAASPVSSPLSIGVVAVEERVLRLSDQALFGVYLENAPGGGARIGRMDLDGGADEAGLRVGDVLLELDGEVIQESYELGNRLREKSPGDPVTVKYRRGGEEKVVEVILGSRAKYKKFPEGRLRVMRAMGGPISLRSDDFPVVVQTDMQLRPEQCGGPVTDLDGNVVGLTISRTDRTRSFIIPSARIQELLEVDPVAPELAERPGTGRGQEMASNGPRPEVVPVPQGAANSLRAHLEEMSDFIRRMEREMAPFEP